MNNKTYDISRFLLFFTSNVGWLTKARLPSRLCMEKAALTYPMKIAIDEKHG